MILVWQNSPRKEVKQNGLALGPCIDECAGVSEQGANSFPLSGKSGYEGPDSPTVAVVFSSSFKELSDAGLS